MKPMLLIQLYITGSAIVDCRSTNGSARSFKGSGGLVMDGGRLRIKIQLIFNQN